MNEAIGWRWLMNSPKWHYFDADGRSLCGKWMALSKAPGSHDNNDSPDNCAACRRIRARLAR